MPIEDHLIKLKNEVERELNEFFDDKIKQAEKQEKPKEFLEMVKNLKRFTLSGGKRIRPILFYYGYLIAGGEKREDIIKAAISIELIHSYLLIHDDIIDKDDFRHNDLTMHCQYEKEYKNKSGKNNSRTSSLSPRCSLSAEDCSDLRVFSSQSSAERLRRGDKREEVLNSKHFGASMAIITGDLMSSLGYEILIRSDFPPNLKIKAVEKLNQIILNTITGEAMDVVLAEYPNANTSDVLKMQRYKTAKYTIEGPLHLGAILAGANEKFLKSISEFAIPLGIAFQIQDDIIGVFGNEKRIGKLVGADIKEGKKTLLSVKVFERANREQLKILSESFGNKNINLSEVNAVREIIKKTGSLEYSLEKVDSLIKLSKKHFEEMKIPEKHKKRLLRLADFMAERKF